MVRGKAKRGRSKETWEEVDKGLIRHLAINPKPPKHSVGERGKKRHFNWK